MDEIYEKSIEELDGEAWGTPPADSTGLVVRIHELRTVKLRDLSDDDVVTLLLQHEGADWLIPMALDQLDEEQLKGDWYPGQLLGAVLHNRAYFESSPDDLGRLHSIRVPLVQRHNDLEKVLLNPDWPPGI